MSHSSSSTPPRPQARWSDGVCKTCGAYTHSCKCEHPARDTMRGLFAAPQEGAGSSGSPGRQNGEPAAAASTPNSETTAGSEPGLTVQGYRFPASLVRGLTPFGEQQAVNEAAWELVRRKADTNMNRCQELAQAAVAAYRASVERQLNPMEQSAIPATSTIKLESVDIHKFGVRMNYSDGSWETLDFPLAVEFLWGVIASERCRLPASTDSGAKNGQ
jgi:hypothetical protein